MIKEKKGKKVDIDTETHILACAKNVFIRKGFAATRMQDIAEETGMNQALLHYYFRSKDKLFEQIFDQEAMIFFRSITELWVQDKPILDIFDDIFEQEINKLRLSPHLPMFIMQEITQNAERMTEKLKMSIFQNNPQQFIFEKIKKAIENKEIREVAPEQIFVTVQSLIIFPFIAKPMMMMILGPSETAFEQFLIERIAFSKHFMRTYLSLE